MRKNEETNLSAFCSYRVEYTVTSEIFYYFFYSALNVRMEERNSGSFEKNLYSHRDCIGRIAKDDEASHQNGSINDTLFQASRRIPMYPVFR